MRRIATRQHSGRPRCLLETCEPRRLLSLVHLYTFNDGTLHDTVGSADGTLINGAFVSNGRLQLQNAGITSGQSALIQYAQLPANLLPASGSATIELWYNTDSAVPTGMRVFDFGGGAGSSQSFLYYTPLSSGGDARAGLLAPGGTERTASVGAPANQGYQNMAALVVDASAGTISMYLNGTLTDSTPLAGATIGSVNAATAYLGRSLTNSDPGFSGSIDELRIYDNALSAAAIAADAAAGPAPFSTASTPARQVEDLDRGLIALPRTGGGMYVSWRLLASDPVGVAFNLYRSTSNGAPVKVNAQPITQTTDFSDTAANIAQTLKYFVRPIVNGVEQAPSETFTTSAGSTAQYLRIPLQVPPGGTTPDGVAYTYSANDASVADVDGDGQYEIILKWDPSNSKDNSQSGYTGNTYIDCYKMNGTRLWRIDLGQNIRAGAHYTQFIAYDLDGDGKAEVAMRTAPGTIDGQGHYVLMGNDNPATDYRNSSGYNLTSPEYLTIFNGQTGAAMVSTAFHPDRGNVNQWGDTYGNRVDRILMAVAYLDGQRPSLVVGRGIFPGQSASVAVRNEVAAYDYRNGQLTQRWWFKAAANFNNNINSNYIGQGTYDMQPADVDGDGKDEIIYGAMAIDDDGTPLYSTGLGHGDALHITDMDPNHPGLEVFMPHETPSQYGAYGGEFRDARTGEELYAIDGHNDDVGRGVAFDVDPRYPGYESWQSADTNMYSTNGSIISARPSDYNFGVWWDADPLRELLDSNHIDKWNWTTSSLNRILTMSGTSANNGTKATPCLSGDILGDWREEVVMRASDSSELRIYSTTIPAASRMVTLIDDIQYREAIAWQNVGYNQPPDPSFFIGNGMAAPPIPNVYAAGAAPSVQNFQVNDGSAQRSAVTSLTVTFNTVVNLAAAAMAVSLHNSDGSTTPVTFNQSNPSHDGRTYVVTFTTPLADGMYDLHVSGAKVTNLAGAAMSTDPTFAFHRLFGDHDGNGQIDAADIAWLGQTYGKQAGQPGFDPNLDFNGDHVINRTDFNQFIRHLTISYDTSAETVLALPSTASSATLAPPLLPTALAKPSSVSPAIVRKALSRLRRIDSISLINAMHRFR